jgi:pimeloyl-ACP methyl ester carboxylesterase
MFREHDRTIHGVSTHIKEYGEGKTTVVLLHGWGISGEKYDELAHMLVEGCKPQSCRLFVPDAPGFGNSGDPSFAWDVSEYVSWLEDFMHEMGLETSHIIAHSFGARIAIKYSTESPHTVSSLVLTGAAGIKRPLTIKQTILFVSAKIVSLPGVRVFKGVLQKLFARVLKRKDYHNAKGIMKEVMQKVTAENLIEYLPQVSAPTLLLWGKNDQSTPLSDGKTMHRMIPNAKLIVIDDAQHSLIYQKPTIATAHIINFLKEYA